MLLSEIIQEEFFRSKTWASNMIARKNGEELIFHEIGKAGWNKLSITISMLKAEDFYAVSFLQKPEEKTGISLCDILRMEKIETKLFRSNTWVDGVVMKVVDGTFYIANIEYDNWMKYPLSTQDVLDTNYRIYDL